MKKITAITVSLILTAAFLFFAPRPVSAYLIDKYEGFIQKIKLKDGRVLEGQITDIRNGFYTVRTEGEQETTVSNEDIEDIMNLKRVPSPSATPPHPPSGAAASPGISPGVPGTPAVSPDASSHCSSCSASPPGRYGHRQPYQQPGQTQGPAPALESLLADPEVRAKLGDMEDDPELEKFLEIMKKQGTYRKEDAVDVNDPDLLHTMDDPRVRELQDMLLRKFNALTGAESVPER